MNDTLYAVGIDEIPPGESEASLLRKILLSQLVYNRVMEHLVATFAPDVIRAMPELERAGLRNKLIPLKTGAAKNPATWTMHEAISNGQPYLQGLCHACNQDLKFPGPPPRNHNGRVGVTKADVSKALDSVAFAHCGHIEKLPADFRTHAEYIFQRIVNVEGE